MSELVSKQAVLDALDSSKYSNEFCEEHNIDWSINLGMAHIAVNELETVNPSAENKQGRWVRMSDLPEDKDDRYKCSQCGNVVHHSNGVNLYTFNSWCGRCGSLNNSLLASLKQKKAVNK